MQIYMILRIKKYLKLYVNKKELSCYLSCC
jgi:hypothetical protein